MPLRNVLLSNSYLDNAKKFRLHYYEVHYEKNMESTETVAVIAWFSGVVLAVRWFRWTKNAKKAELSIDNDKK